MSCRARGRPASKYPRVLDTAGEKPQGPPLCYSSGESGVQLHHANLHALAE
jgi:hypothetical protein